ncbi:LysM peptidoglycan-binding domain-containing protein [Tropicibacter sp. R16_0]|uniref:LysM peptidoglycan-binding domain-containing protein n=1 Tax=Tropicibacter sp. R16_0 TaxID=2821102 RepID=UPI001ADD4AD8|nr:LysM peptidoglycan-binding domain-containing protein [Tropicibacter sp. R16_0]MBO9452014.1 LysM peptidoglycan-binding domain-containing protein [Tropicibacter sp. R16_0]
MAASAGAGGLSALGWVVVAGGVAVAGAAGLYFSGVLKPEPEVEQVTVAEPKPDPAPVQAAEPVKTEPEPPAQTESADPKPAEDPEQTAQSQAQPDAEAPESEQAADATDTPEAAPEPEQTVDAEPEVAVNPEPEAEPVAEEEPQAAPEPVVPALAAPSLDTIRIEPDGSAILAGKAAPGSELSVRLDGAEIERAQVDRSGAFALFLTLPFSDAPRGLSLIAELDGQTARSDDYLLAALPKPQPVQVAEAEVEVVPEETAPVAEKPEADPQPEEQTASVEPKPTPAEDTVEPEAPQVTEAEAEAEAPADPAPVAQEVETTVADAQEAAPEPVQVTEADPVADPEPVQQTEQVASTEVPTEEVAEETVAQAVTDAPAKAPDTTETASAETEPEPDTTETATNETAPEPEETVQEEPRAVAILKSDEKGVELVQAPTSAEPDVETQIALDTIGYSDAGDVQLTGRATQGALVRVYLNNLAVSDVVTDTDGRWRGELDDVTPGIYTLRVDELGPGDVVLSRLETPFKREAPEVLQPKEPEPGIAPETPAIRAVTVQKGDTLWAISRERYGDGVLYVKVFEANRGAIRNPDLIYPGQVFNIPE